MTSSQPITDRRLSTFWTCMEKHRIEYELGYRPPHFESGRLSRAWPAIANRTFLAASLPGAPESPVTEDLIKKVVGWIPSHYHWIDRAKLAATAEAAIRVLSEGQFFQRQEVLLVGAPYSFQHLNPDTKAPSPLWSRSGVVDAVVRHRYSGDLSLVKHLTTDEPIDLASRYWDRIRMDNRVAADVIGAATHGYRVSTVIYMAASKCQLSPLMATPAEKRRYTVASPGEPSRLYAGQRAEPESKAEFYERVRLALVTSPMDYFRTAHIPWDERRTEAPLKDAWNASQVMRIARLNGWSPRNPDACHRFGTCPWFRVCCGQEGLDSERFRSSVPVDEEVPKEALYKRST